MKMRGIHGGLQQGSGIQWAWKILLVLVDYSTILGHWVRMWMGMSKGWCITSCQWRGALLSCLHVQGTEDWQVGFFLVWSLTTHLTLAWLWSNAWVLLTYDPTELVLTHFINCLPLPSHHWSTLHMDRSWSSPNLGRFIEHLELDQFAVMEHEWVMMVGWHHVRMLSQNVNGNELRVVYHFMKRYLLFFCLHIKKTGDWQVGFYFILAQPLTIYSTLVVK